MANSRADREAGREFTIEDVADVEAVWPELQPLVVGTIEYHQAWDPRKLRGDWASRMREHMASQAITLIARDKRGRAIGFLNGSVTSDFGIFDEVVGQIHNVFVVEAERECGVGSAMLRHCEELCRRQGVRELRLNVLAANQLGLSFWRRSGFSANSHQMCKQLEAS